MGHCSFATFQKRIGHTPLIDPEIPSVSIPLARTAIEMTLGVAGEAGARQGSVLARAFDIDMRIDSAHMARRPIKVAAIALANKFARIAWALMTRGTRYRESLPQAV